MTLGKLTVGINDFATARPNLCHEWNYTLNGDLKPNMVAFGSHKKVWWSCGRGHDYLCRILAKSNGSGCPYCSNQRLLPGFNDLLTTHPEVAKELANIENSPKATEIFAGSEKKAWWKCKNYPHIYESIVKDKVRKNTGCPYCSGNKVLVGFNDLSTTHPALAAEFSKSKNSTIRIENISSGSLRKVWWECSQYRHSYQVSVGERKRGAGCPYCSGKKVLRGFNDLYTTHPLIAREYDEELNGGISVYSLSLGMTKNYGGVVQYGDTNTSHEFITEQAVRAATTVLVIKY